MNINAQNLDYYQLNQAIRRAEGPVVIDHCLGQRFIGTALGAGRSLTIHGVPGNAMGAYLDGGSIEVFGDVQEATGDTMNAGTIVVHGSAGDATGYSMRGGVILIERDVGYRAGIHMKSYGSKVPVLIVGGAAGSFLGEYQAGGLILVLGLGCEDRAPITTSAARGCTGERSSSAPTISRRTCPTRWSPMTWTRRAWRRSCPIWSGTAPPSACPWSASCPIGSTPSPLTPPAPTSGCMQ